MKKLKDAHKALMATVEEVIAELDERESDLKAARKADAAVIADHEEQRMIAEKSEERIREFMGEIADAMEWAFQHLQVPKHRALEKNQSYSSDYHEARSALDRLKILIRK